MLTSTASSLPSRRWCTVSKIIEPRSLANCQSASKVCGPARSRAQLLDLHAGSSIVAVPVDFGGPVVSCQNAAFFVHQQHHVIGKAAQIVVLFQQGPVRDFGLVALAVQVELLAPPEKQHQCSRR